MYLCDCDALVPTVNKPVSPAAEVFSVVRTGDDSHLSVVMDTADAIHLERRVGIGSPNRVMRLIGKTRAEAIEMILEDLASDRRIFGELPAWLSHPNITFG